MLIAICDDEQFFLDYFEKTIKDYYYYDRGMTCQIIKYLKKLTRLCQLFW